MNKKICRFISLFFFIGVTVVVAHSGCNFVRRTPSPNLEEMQAGARNNQAYQKILATKKRTTRKNNGTQSDLTRSASDIFSSILAAPSSLRGSTFRQGTSFPLLCLQCIKISAYIVVFTDGRGGGSEVTVSVLDEQMEILNQAFSETPFLFELQRSQFVVNASLYQSFDDSEDTVDWIGGTYRQGSLRDLNIYIGGVNSGSTAFFPPFASVNEILASENGVVTPFDGAFVAIDTVPGGSSGCCSSGLTLVHEVGHWLGLYHTFDVEQGFEDNPCDPRNPGDYVDDTPQQALPTNFACPDPPQDSCPFLPGNDPSQNFMDYSSDDCYAEFTPGQIERMTYIWSLYRDRGEACPTGYLLFKLSLVTDGSSMAETHWQLTSTDGFIRWGSNRPDSGLEDFRHQVFSTYQQDICIPTERNYNFTMIDMNGFAGGSYQLSLAGQTLRSGSGLFRERETTLFSTAAFPTPSATTAAPTVTASPSRSLSPSAVPSQTASFLPTGPPPTFAPSQSERPTESSFPTESSSTSEMPFDTNDPTTAFLPTPETSIPSNIPSSTPTITITERPSSSPSDVPRIEESAQQVQVDTSINATLLFGGARGPGICDDFLDQSFVISRNRSPRDCAWLRNLPSSLQERYCRPGTTGAYDVCEETCGKCTDVCRDDDTGFFVDTRASGTTGLLTGFRRTCKWLRDRPNERVSLCREGMDAFRLCPETCNSCPNELGRIKGSTNGGETTFLTKLGQRGRLSFPNIAISVSLDFFKERRNIFLRNRSNIFARRFSNNNGF